MLVCFHDIPLATNSYHFKAGCYVPANFASIRLTDRLATRIGTEDSIETNSSSFLLEMKEMSYIVNSVTNRALVVIGTFSGRTNLSFGLQFPAFLFRQTNLDEARPFQMLSRSVLDSVSSYYA